MTKHSPEPRDERLTVRLSPRERLWLNSAAAAVDGGEGDTARKGMLTWLEAVFPHLRPTEPEAVRERGSDPERRSA